MRSSVVSQRLDIWSRGALAGAFAGVVEHSLESWRVLLAAKGLLRDVAVEEISADEIPAIQFWKPFPARDTVLKTHSVQSWYSFQTQFPHYCALLERSQIRRSLEHWAFAGRLSIRWSIRQSLEHSRFCLCRRGNPEIFLAAFVFWVLEYVSISCVFSSKDTTKGI